jgi:glycosyltransferase involved in cell wall biosynthesis
MQKSKIFFFTKYSVKGPSSRYRTFNYVPYFEEYFDCKVFNLFDDFYIEALYSRAKKVTAGYLFKRYLRRVFQIIFHCERSAVVVVEYELFPYFFSVFEYILKAKGCKIILDYDDAIFHNYDSSGNKVVRFLLADKIPSISRIADHIITGSPYLTDFFKKYIPTVTEIPTSIDFDKYVHAPEMDVRAGVFSVGWLGSNSTSKNLIELIPAFQEISAKYDSVLFQFCGISPDVAAQFKNFRFEILEWSPLNELELLKRIQVGIMPLEMNPFNNGKCGFKLIQYMAMGKPTISTPLAANIKIDHQNGNLFATSYEEWVKEIEYAFENYESFKEVGKKNQITVRKDYSIQMNYLKYIEIFKKINT